MSKYSEHQQEAIQVALSAIQETLSSTDVMASVEDVKNYLKLSLAAEVDEWFCVMFLSSQHHLIRFEKLFRGTVNAAYVHVRVIARMALELNAAVVVLAHNHPSGVAEPSAADQRITSSIQKALEIFDVRVLDHFIVSAQDSYSFAECGML